MTGAPGERVYRAVIRCYPRAFRERYGDEMLAFYRERWQREVPPRLRDSIATWLNILADALVTATAERLTPTAPIPGPQEETMSTLLQDIRYALRGMLRRPGFAAVVLATLALGIGANAAIFSVVDGVLLRPLPFHDAERIVDMFHNEPYSSVSEPEFMDYKRDMRSLSKLAAYFGGEVTVSGADEPHRAYANRVSTDFFSILGVSPALGRTFAPDEYSHLSKSQIAVISNGLWQQELGGDPRAVGKTVKIGASAVTVIGVMPAGFNFPSPNTAIWFPWRLNPDSLWTRNNHYLRLVGQLAPGVSVERARAEALSLDRRWVKDFPETYAAGKELVLSVNPIREHLVGATRPYLLALLGAVAFILLIACVNVANLLLVRGEARRKEIAIRTALGASSTRLVRQMLTESVLFAAGGAVLGLGIAWASTQALVALAPSSVPRLDAIHVDYRVVAFTLIVTLVTGVLFGIVPAVRGMRGDSADTLRDGGKTSGAQTVARGARRVLVVTEVALAVIMLCGAGLLVRSLWNLQSIALGFETRNVLTLDVTLSSRQYKDPQAVEFFRQVSERISSLPGVRAVGATGALPITGDESRWSILIDGRVVKTIAESPSAKPVHITPGYFAALRIPIARGRAFTDADRPDAQMVAIINETMAKELYPGVDPIGHTLKMFSDKAPWATIVGVAKDVRSGGFQSEVPATMFFPVAQSGQSAYYTPLTMTLIVRADRSAAALGPAVRDVIHAIDRAVPISRVKTMDAVVGGSIASRRFTTLLLAAFAALALLLAGIGIYGVIAYGVSQRTFEIGVRMALGATATSVMRMVVIDGLRMTGVGLALGILGAVFVERLLRAMLVGVNAFDMPTFAAVAAALLLVAALACLVPARRAMAVSPTEALRG